jgi:(1->4)-alpha-D-glucan 1-alpha-D-glucosylmutase
VTPPRATYRLQLRPGFGFDDAAAIVPYLAELGFSHVYCSPYLQAGPGSTHGYDVADPGRVNAELGGPEAHRRFVEALRREGLGQVLDIVPNHMTNKGRANRWWWDLLEYGRWSRSAIYFDLNWHPFDPKLHNKVLLPILGEHYGALLARGDLLVRREGPRFIVRYGEHEMPLKPRSLESLYSAAADRLGPGAFAQLAARVRTYPKEWEDAEALYWEAGEVERALEDLLQHEPGVGETLDAVVAELNASPALLDDLLRGQHYRLAYWRTGSREINYRRFFVENALVGVCVEHERVFGSMHGKVLQWVREGLVDGLRIDHIDGLRDPQAYLDRLREQAQDAWIVVEKILETDEAMPMAWPVQGTTGYDFLNVVLGLFIDPRGEEPLTRFYAEYTGQPVEYPPQVREKKLRILSTSLASEVYRLTLLLVDISEQHWQYRDYTVDELLDVLREFLACFPVYRTYTRPGHGEVSEQDRRIVLQATERAKFHRPDAAPQLFDYIRDLLLLNTGGPLEADFVYRFQQLGGPAMAKGVEDTLYYTYNRFVALNEVGGHPQHFGTSPDRFQAFCSGLQARWPLTMTATSTHDTKRSEGVRARLCLLSEIPDAWRAAVERWTAMNERHRTPGVPDPNDEYLFYQTVVGAWPLGVERAREYMLKAIREAKVHTDWTEPVAAYEEPLLSFVQGALEDPEFTADLERFVAPLIPPGRVNALAQALLKLAGPGLPDTYQGTELWDLSLVDPDNRRPVDYALRRRLLGELDALSVEEMLARSDEGLPKLWMLRQALRLRARRPEACGPDAGYRPLTAQGKKAMHAVGFVRTEKVAAVVPRLILGLANDWGDTTIELPEGAWQNVLTSEPVNGESVAAQALLGRFPVALLERET